MKAPRAVVYVAVLVAVVASLAGCSSRHAATKPLPGGAPDGQGRPVARDAHLTDGTGGQAVASTDASGAPPPKFDAADAHTPTDRGDASLDAGATASKHCPEVACPPERPTCSAGHCICVPTCSKGTTGCCGPDGCGGWVGCPSGQICLWPQNHCADVQPDCHDGWCKIPAGSMWIPDAGPFIPIERNSNTLVWMKRPKEIEYPEFPVLLTRTYLMQQTPMTCNEIAALLGETLPYCEGRGGSCPVTGMSFMGALWVANMLSQAEGLEPCYVLQNCVGDPLLPIVDDPNWKFDAPPPKAFQCERAWFKGLDCTGYRVPTWGEWMYALRAGALGTFWYGIEPELSLPPNSDEQPYMPYWDVTPSACKSTTPCGLPGESGGCPLHPVGSFLPNPFGLYDLLFLNGLMVHGVGPTWTQVHELVIDPYAEPSWVDNLDFGLTVSDWPGLPRPVRALTHDGSSEWERTRPSPTSSGVALRFVRTVEQTAPPPEYPGYLHDFPPEPRWLMLGRRGPPPSSYCYLPELGWSVCCWVSFKKPWMEHVPSTLDLMKAYPPAFEGYDYDMSIVQCDGDAVLDPDPFDLLPDVP